jgi:hypothetical protein
VKGKASAVRRVAFIKAQRAEHKLSFREHMKIVVRGLIEHMFWPFLCLRDLLFPKESRRSRTRK